MPNRNLAAIINANPGCVVLMEDGGWTLYRKHPKHAPDDAEEAWLKQNKLASGTDLQALANTGIEIEVEDA